MSKLEANRLDLSPKKLRRTVLSMAKNGDSVHIACAFSLIEIVSVLYQNIARIHLDNPMHPDRDIIGLSKGHGVMAFYACFLEMGWLEKSHIDKYFSDGSPLKGLSDCHIPGIEVSGGSLGHGLSVAVGMALAAKLKGKDQKIFCIVGDGEMNEGSMWESLLFAAHRDLSNLIVIVDANEFQAMGRSTEVLNCESFSDKFKAFNFDVWECDGHDMAALTRVFRHSLEARDNGRPKAVIARTKKGRGISFMEGDNRWHYTRLTEQSFADAMKELAE